MKKKINKYFKNTISGILILSIISVPLLEPAKVYAQNGSYGTSGSYSANGSSTKLGGISGYLKALSPALAQLPLCQEKLISAKTKLLFKMSVKLSKLVGKNKKKTKDESKKERKKEKDSAEASIPVSNSTLESITEESKDEQKEGTKKLGELAENDTCLKSIGRMVARLLLQKITASTVEWINNGYDGKPFFVEKPGEFFGDMAKNEILSFKLQIDDYKNYPYSREYLKSLIKKKFSYNARYSMNELIRKTTPQYTAKSYYANFSSGGWGAWDAMTQVPANNPIGFYLIASEELTKKTQARKQKVKEALDQAGGFLGQEVCEDPEGITRTQHNQALAKGEKEYKINFIDNNQNGTPDKEEGFEKPEGQEEDLWHREGPTGYIVGTCKKWKYVTPGKLIAEAATNIINYPKNALLEVDDLNVAISAILDAVLNDLTARVLNDGFSNYTMSGSYEIAGYQLMGDLSSQVDKDFPESMRDSDWLRAHPDFNIRTSLTQAIIDEQRIYQRKLREQNKVLDDLITTTYQLDYCIPGPHPGFAKDSRRTLSATINAIPSKTAFDFSGSNETTDTMTELAATLGPAVGGAIGSAIAISAATAASTAAAGAAIGSAVPGLGTAIGAAVGLLIGYAIEEFAGLTSEELVDIYYARIFLGLTGIPLYKGTKELNWCGGKNKIKFCRAYITNKRDIVLPLKTILSRYIELINKYYNKNTLPTVTPHATIEFNKIKNYKKNIQENENAITALDNIIIRLSDLKDILDDIRSKEGTLDQDGNIITYTHTDYLPHINEFARLTENMVTGNSIQAIFDLTAEYVSGIKYVYEDLIAGDFGCEKGLEDANLDPRLKATKRPMFGKEVYYPFKIWYPYKSSTYKVPALRDIEIAKYYDDDVYDEGGTLIHKGNEYDKRILDKFTGNRPPKNYSFENGPGFLSYVHFGTINTKNVDKEGYDGTVYPNFYKDDVYCKFPESIYDSEESKDNTKESTAISKKSILDCIYIADSFYTILNKFPTTVGRCTQAGVAGCSDGKTKKTSFEQIIGIY